MPFTPLHLAAGLPVKIAAKERFSLSAFIAMNLAIDVQPALVMFFGTPYALHGASHTILFVGVVLAFLAIVRPRRIPRGPWLLGGAWGGISHLILDALMHADVRLPFEPAFPSVIHGLVPPAILDLACLGVSVVCLGYFAWRGGRRRQRPPR